MVRVFLSLFSNVLRPCVAIIGSGPAGFYTAHHLLKKNTDVFVDIIEKLPVPFGLIRFGVAPDHPQVKNVINRFTTLAKSERCRFIGNINVGKYVTTNDIIRFYNCVVMSYGADDDKLLGIPGESLEGVVSARHFVGWYNGLPEHRNFNPDLSGDTAVILGQGNVALDITRILLTPLELLEKTDICSHSVEGLRNSKIKKVILVGRGGPLQTSFSIKEFRNVLRLPGCQTILHSKDFDPYRGVTKDLARPRKRMVELMMKTADEFHNCDEASTLFELRFLRSPVEFLTTPEGFLRGIKLEINELETNGDTVKAVGTGQYEEIECSFVVRSIGYKGTLIDPDIPFDSHLGIIPNNGGRVVDSNGDVIQGLYCSGWVKRGPVGGVLITMNDAFETAEAIAHDIANDKVPPIASSTDILKYLECRKPVKFSDWEKIDSEEQRRGQKLNKPREKIVSIEEMLHIATLQKQNN